MAIYQGRPVLSGELSGEALVSRQPFNTSGSYLNNMFGGVTDSAICTDQDNPEIFEKELKDCILCTPATIGSTAGSAAFMGVLELGIGPQALLFSDHIDSIAACGVLMEDIWNGKRVIVVDLLGDEFMEAVNTGDPIKISEDGTVEVG